MISFLILWIIVSIIVSLLSGWLRIIPAYPKRVYTILVHVVDTAILTVVLTVLLAFDIHPDWIIVFGLILMSLVCSVWLINGMVHKADRPAGDSAEMK